MNHSPTSSPSSPSPGVALVTGGGQRVGASIARHLATLGWQVAVHYHRSHSEAEKLRQDHENISLFKADLADSDAIAPLMAAIHEQLGPVTLLVNNAAVFERDNVHTLTPESLEKHLAINLRAPLLLAQEMMVALPDTAQGQIIHISDGCDGMCMQGEFLSYTLSKRALEEATRLLAMSAPSNIRINAISPGLTLPQPGQEDSFPRLSAKLPLQTSSSAEEVCAAIDYFLHTTTIRGQILHLGGGAHLTERLTHYVGTTP